MIIEEGKYYRCMDGGIVGPAIISDPPDTRFPWILAVGKVRCQYTDTGRAYYSSASGPLQLIEEVPKPD